jgi:putative FmdB family regulatory protein
MPTYDYKCLECNNKFELFQPMSAEPIEVCPECNGKVKRLIGAGSGPIFKGSGFYQTDYKNKSAKSNKPASTVKPSKDSGAAKPDSSNSQAPDKKG